MILIFKNRKGMAIITDSAKFKATRAKISIEI